MPALLETRRGRHSLVAALHQEADRAPGARHVYALRRDHKGLFAREQGALHREFRTLGVHVEAVAQASGGLVLESASDVSARVRAILAAAGIKAWIEARFRPIYDRLYAATGRITMATLARTGIPVTGRDRVEQRLFNESGKRLGLLDIEKQTKESLFKIIDIGRERGLNPRQTGAMIRDLVPKGRYVNAGSTYRSETIARSEVMHAQRIGSIETYRRSKVIQEAIAFDGDGDAECLARNGTRMPFDKAEQEAANTHPNCVLVFGPAIA